jgi:hypothetical protein
LAISGIEFPEIKNTRQSSRGLVLLAAALAARIKYNNSTLAEKKEKNYGK